MTSNILQFDAAGNNALNDADYSSNTQRSTSGVSAGLASSALFNKFMLQTSTMAYAIGQVLSDAGYTVSDDDAVQLVTDMAEAFIVPTATTSVQGKAELATTAEAQALADTGRTLTPSGLAGVLQLFAVVQDQKAQNTEGGTFTSGAWRTRDLNTEVTDAKGIVSVASNQFTLAAGTYIIYGAAPCNQSGISRARIQNITDGATVAMGQNGYANTAGVYAVLNTVIGLVTIAGSKVFELQHYCTNTKATEGFGSAQNIASTVETYASVAIWKVG